MVSYRLDAGYGANIVLGGGGNDALVAGGGSDIVFGGSGNDTISTNGGNDTVLGDAISKSDGLLRLQLLESLDGQPLQATVEMQKLTRMAF